MIPFVLLHSESIWLRRFFAFFGLLIWALSWSGWFHHWIIAFGLTAVTAGALWLYKRVKDPVFPILGLGLVLLLFASVSMFAKMEMRTQFPYLQEDQLMASPSPGNPFCWWLLLSGFTGSGERQTVSAIWSPLHRIFEVPGCFFSQTGPWQRKHEGMVWKQLASSPFPREKDCISESILLFMRFPIYLEAQALWKDARFMGFKGPRFEFGRDEVCPGSLPPWQSPSKLK